MALRTIIDSPPTSVQTLTEQFLEDVRRGLGQDPKALSPKWFYDAIGSDIFEQITQLDEYYPTRREREILADRATEIATLLPTDTLIELGSGASVKTTLLLDAILPPTFIPFDVCEEAIDEASRRLAERYPRMDIHGIVGDFERDLARLPTGKRRLVAFLGGTIGNLTSAQRSDFLQALGEQLQPGDGLLLGADLVKDPERLVLAYDDRFGVTAAFNRNVLERMRRELGADVDPDAFQHVALWDPHNEWIEMRLRAISDQWISIPGADVHVEFRAGEELRTEISAKFRREGLAPELAAAGFSELAWWTDKAGDFSLSLWEKKTVLS